MSSAPTVHRDLRRRPGHLAGVGHLGSHRLRSRVVIGSPAITIAAVSLNRTTLLLGLIALFVVGNIASALSVTMGMLIVARFITGTVQGAYFGAGAVVAAHV